MSTVTKINMCKRDWKDLISTCTAQTTEGQENCTHYIKHSFRDMCMFYRKDMDKGCDNQWAQMKKEMPEEVIKMFKNWPER